MRIEPIKLNNQNKLIDDYRSEKQNIMQHFDYSPFHQYEQRVEDLAKRSFKREELARLLFTANKAWDAPTSTINNIKRLKRPESVVVIGGQQAGLLTGPLYSLNKVISIIQFARKQEEKLNIPVIPVFWIAGEDHDYEEVNHAYTLRQNKLKKVVLNQIITEKQPVSSIELDKEQTEKWFNQLFADLKETKHTKNLYETLTSCLNESKTFVDFFARVIFKLFQEEGLVLIDSNDPNLRELESEYFTKMIQAQTEIAAGVHESLNQLKHAGYTIDLAVEPDDAHLFYFHENERVLLKRESADVWVGKQEEVKLSTVELLEIADKTPNLLSNNVVTRPVMQELVFPTLAFIGGNGEISYWSVLKKAFDALAIKMPPVLPRLSFTYVDYALEQKMKKLTIQPEQALRSGVTSMKINWLSAQLSPPLEQLVAEIKTSIAEIHTPLRKLASSVRADLGDLADKNLTHLENDIDFLSNQIERAITEKHANVMRRFDEINHYLYPLGGLQERVWNPLAWLNEHGLHFMQGLITADCDETHEHFIVYL